LESLSEIRDFANLRGRTATLALAGSPANEAALIFNPSIAAAAINATSPGPVDATQHIATVANSARVSGSFINILGLSIVPFLASFRGYSLP